VGVEQFREDGRSHWCEFNALILAQEERQQDEILPKDEVEAASSSRLNDVGRRRDNTGEGKGGDDASLTDANLTVSKNE
jgi:hypothetical protein